MRKLLLIILPKYSIKTIINFFNLILQILDIADVYWMKIGKCFETKKVFLQHTPKECSEKDMIYLYIYCK